jgi:CO/xanthine dehydrogenase Mo-binding subunit
LKITFALIASHELGIPVERVTVVRPDTDLCPKGTGIFEDFPTTIIENAVRNTVIDSRDVIAEVVAN